HSTAQHSTVNNFFAFLFVLAMTAGMLQGMTLTAWGNEPAYSGGTGTQTDPYLISTVDDFKTLAQTVNNGTDYSQKYFRQTASFDMNGVNDLSPVGTLEKPFAGNYEGDGFTISNATITGIQFSYQNYNMNVAGVFGALVGGGSISNLIIKNATITATAGTGGWDQAYAGGLVAFAEDCTITDCSVSNSTINANGSNIFAGAFVGFAGAENSEKTAFSECASENNTVKTMDYGGGFVGAIVNNTNSDDAISFTDCYSANNTADAGSHTYGTVGAFLGASQGESNGNVTAQNCFVYSCDATATGTGAKKGLFTGDTYYGTVKATNTYYYDTNSLEVKADSATAKTVEEMKSLASTLGEEFSQGSDYPILLHPLNIELSIEGWTYGETAKEPIVTRNSSISATYTYAIKGSANFSTTVPADVGDYTVKATIAATNIHKAGEASADFTIAKADATVATAPTAKTLTYNGQPQELITAGTTNGGTMVYALGDNATTSPENDKYNVDIPTGTDNKIYYVWYKVTGSNYNDSIAQCIQVTITLESYTISYSGLEGSSGVSGNPTSYTMKSSDITLINPTKTGYTFEKWTSGDVAITSIPQGTTGNINLKANWTANTYTIKFNGNGGTGSMDNLTLTYDVEGRLTDNKFTRTGYTFSGWKDNANNNTYNGGATVKNLTSEDGGEITLYAQWTEDAKNPDAESESESNSDNSGSGDTAKETPESNTTDAAEILNMSEEKIAETFANKTEITLTGNISNENLSAVIEKIASVTEVKTLDLSQIEGVTEVKLPATVAVEVLNVAGNKSVTKIEVQNNTSLQKIDLSESKVETVDVKGCTELTEIVLTNCDELQYLDVSETPITKLDTSNCEKLLSINCSSCDIVELNIDGCKKLSDLNCANNHLTMLDVSQFLLKSLECEHQTVTGFRRKASFNILDILLRRFAVFVTSDANDDLGYVANVKDVTGIDENGNGFSPTSYDDETGEVVFSKAPVSIKYNYITGFKDISMDVTVGTSGDEYANTIGGSGSGCNMSWGLWKFLMLLLVVKLFGNKFFVKFVKAVKP
ncbi:MAG: InlB B-repeat-containing protein, partial [Synergistaceae bacterium]|nr:InlB B-repeat-containing protein [Synergistaceae bacterium]